MENTWTLEVTQDHIDNAVVYDMEKWAIALALRDMGVCEMYVNTTSIEINSMDGNEEYMFYKADKTLKEWQWDAMDKDICKPITIEFNNENRSVRILE